MLSHIGEERIVAAQLLPKIGWSRRSVARLQKFPNLNCFRQKGHLPRVPHQRVECMDEGAFGSLIVFVSYFFQIFATQEMPHEFREMEQTLQAGIHVTSVSQINESHFPEFVVGRFSL